MIGLPWFLFFWVVMPVLAYGQWGGWLGVFLLLAIYAVGIVVVRGLVQVFRR